MGNFRFWVWPTEHRVITQHFGANPHNYAQFGLPGHEGVDIRAPHGTKVYAVADGVVARVHLSPHGHNYGVHVRINHIEGYQTTYAHFHKALVKIGDEVKAGDVIGLADNTGNSFGSHLHMTLKRKGAKVGKWPSGIVDPTPFLLPLMGWEVPAGPYVDGWVLTASILRVGKLAQAAVDDITLRISKDETLLIPGGTIMVLRGESNSAFTPVRVPRVAVGLDDDDDLPTLPAPPPPPTITTIDGWAWADYLNLHGEQGIINTRYGINLRTQPTKESRNIGIVGRGSTVSILQPEGENGYLRVRVRRADFVGPVDGPYAPPDPDAYLSDLPDGIVFGWVATQFLKIDGEYAETPHRSINLRSQPSRMGQYVGSLKGDATVTLAGTAVEEFLPVLVNSESLIRVASPMPDVTLPNEVGKEGEEVQKERKPLPKPAQRTKGGWVLTNDIHIMGYKGRVGNAGIHLRQAPRRDATPLGYVPGGSEIFITDRPRGEFMPVRVPLELLQPPIDAPIEEHPQPEPQPLGRARIGLHASADPDIGEQEFAEFAALRPGVIKVLSFHSGEDIARLAREHARASFVVRAFLDFGGRQISSKQFVDDTFSDVKRAVDQLHNHEVVVELHNEPNLTLEGLGSSWQNGHDFADWWLEVLALYRQKLPGVRYIYPGLSPGTTVSGIKQDHIQFVEASRTAVEAADGLATHIYWSNVYPMKLALNVLDDYISRFRNTPIWITEASNNKSGTPIHKKAQEYIQFWNQLQQRPVVRGVTYFVASASNPEFREEVWVGNGLGHLVGKR